jgi:hypothetical protein
VLAAPVPDWVRESDAAAQPMLKVIAQFAPEGAQRLGVEGVDDKVVDLGPAYSERYRAALEATAKDLEAKLATTREPKVREDIQILIDNAHRKIDAEKLEDALLLPFHAPARTAFAGIFSLSTRASRRSGRPRRWCACGDTRGWSLGARRSPSWQRLAPSRSSATRSSSDPSGQRWSRRWRTASGWCPASLSCSRRPG